MNRILNREAIDGMEHKCKYKTLVVEAILDFGS